MRSTQTPNQFLLGSLLSEAKHPGREGVHIYMASTGTISISIALILALGNIA